MSVYAIYVMNSHNQSRKLSYLLSHINKRVATTGSNSFFITKDLFTFVPSVPPHHPVIR